MKSLAEFLQEKMEIAGLSTTGLSKKSNIKLDILEDLISGKELFLSVTQRQQLAKILKCSINEIKEHEKTYIFNEISPETISELKKQILNRVTNLKCPICGEPLITRIARSYDLDDNLILKPKAHCVKCVFQIKD